MQSYPQPDTVAMDNGYRGSIVRVRRGFLSKSSISVGDSKNANIRT